MSTYKAVTTIEREISRINDIIDRRIERGLSYRMEARRHKLLLVRLSHLRRRAPLGWSFARAFSFF